MAPRSSPNPPQIDEKSMKDGLPHQSKFCILLSGLLVALGGQHGRKSLPKGARGGDDIGGDFAPVFGLGGVLWGLGASWGPRADFNRFLVDF